MKQLFRWCVITLCCHAVAAASPLQEAYESYQAGERADTVAKREEVFNHALEIYVEAEKGSHPDFGNGKLYYDIANTYFQLEQYPLAVFNYYRALKLMPGNYSAQHNLKVALDKAGVTPPNEDSIFRRIFFLQYDLSLPQRLQLFFLFSLLLIAAISCFVWKNSTLWKRAIGVFAILWVVSLLSLGYSRYFSPIEGVIINSSATYRGPGTEYAVNEGNPILAGTKVHVLELLQEGKWLKVMTSDGQIGYLQSSTLRIL